MDRLKSLKQLAKLIDYILARRPDEFGLVPDGQGFVRIKDLLKAIGEEDGFKYVRRGHLDEIRLSLADRSFEIVDNRIRAVDRRHLPEPAPASDLPKLLYTCVRRKAYPHVSEKGIVPSWHSRVVLSSSRQLARRMGKRMDAAAVELTVQVAHCRQQGVNFFQAGQSLFVADRIPAGCFSGPPLPREKPAVAATERPAHPEQQPTPGSFFIDLEKKFAPGGKSKQKDRKNKPRRQPPPWRR